MASLRSAYSPPVIKNLPLRPSLLFLAHLQRLTHTSEYRDGYRDPSGLRGSRQSRSRCHPNGHPNRAPINNRQALLVAALSCHPGGDLRQSSPPRHVPTLNHILQQLPVSQRVHRAPETVIFVGHEVPALNQTGEWLKHQLFTFSDVIEDFIAENKVAAVDPNLGFLTRSQTLNGALLVKFGKMEADWRVNGDKTTDFTARLDTINHVRQCRVGRTIAVV